MKRHPATVAALLLVLLALLATAPARADLTQASNLGFTSSFRSEIQAGTDAAWKAIVQLPRWWSDAHTWSGKAANLSLDAQAGGCWCERWDDRGSAASVQHGQVLMVLPGRALRLRGNLGPLQALPVDGVLDIVTSVQDGKTLLRLSYRVGGPADTGLEQLAPAVDRVMGEQFKRLKALVETGRAD
jgi:uncharacterized protein YndB with AHSA1/START domain